MSRARFGQRFDESRLRRLLAVFLLALAIPTVALIWHARSQLKWESFHQYRGLAEALSGQIDDRLAALRKVADSRSFGDYRFATAANDAPNALVQRSPLSEFPVHADLPGLIGYFQVDSQGSFTTPLLPAKDAGQFGIDDGELAGRQQLARRIETVLADNRLLRSGGALPGRGLVSAPAIDSIERSAGEKDSGSPGSGQRVHAVAPDSDAPTQAPALEEFVLPATADDAAGNAAPDASRRQESADAAGDREMPQPPQENEASEGRAYSQQVFDLLNAPRDTAAPGARPVGESFNAGAEARTDRDTPSGVAAPRVSELKLDADLQKKSESVEAAQRRNVATNAGRFRRPEQAATEADAFDDSSFDEREQEPARPRIDTFASDVDPFEFSQLGSGHLVMFRNVWRDGERFVQGFLLDRTAFIAGGIGDYFYNSGLQAMSSLIVGYHDDVIEVFGGNDTSGYNDSAGALEGALLYRTRLSAPLDRIELIFSLSRLPPGPGSTVLAWVTVVLAIVFAGGFAAMYRFGVGQIRLARQQDDFVSAVSHELKTPLTSIRMYGEMLKEGWVSEEKRRDYYDFIHDESERLTRTISNVLQLAKITRSDPGVDLQPVPAGELLSNVESKITHLVARAGFTLQISRDDTTEHVLVRVDADYFAQIIINLVDNALKFSRHAETKTIDIGCTRRSDGDVQFSVRDYGAGIPKHQMKKIFELFYRSESELTRETTGTGIGLAIVHQLTTAMGGRIDVVNRDPGAEFQLRFPGMSRGSD